MDIGIEEALAKALQDYIRKQVDIAFQEKVKEFVDRMESQKETMTAKEVMERLKISRWTLWKMGERKELEPIGIVGCRKIYSKFDVEEILQQRTKEQTKK